MTTAIRSTPTPLRAALAYLGAGMACIPIRTDGSKAPAVAWREYQTRLPTEEELHRWFADGRAGIAVVCGRVSGNAEVLDFDIDAGTIYPAWQDLAEAEAPGLVDRLTIVRTPRGGYHVWYRCPGIDMPGNTKLAMDEQGKAVLIETRGTGGYALVPGSPPACHGTGRTYDHHSGPRLSQVQTITPDEREILLRCARSFDRAPPADHQTNGHAPYSGGGLSPGDDYCHRGPSWAEIMMPHGWTIAQQRGETTYWRRPGKDGPGWSATTGLCRSKAGHELLAVFSSNAAPFPGPSSGRPCSTHSKFGAYTLLNHAGDFRAAARALAEQEYGDRRHHHNGQAGAPEERQAPPSGTPNEAADDPHRLARIYLAKHIHDDTPTLRWWQSTWLQWDGVCYRDLPEAELRADLSSTIKAETDRTNLEAMAAADPARKVPEARKVTARLVSDVLAALASMTMVPSTVQPPTWLGDPGPWPADEVLVASNGLVHLSSLVEGRECIAEHTPRLFAQQALDYAIDLNAPRPTAWLDFLQAIWPDDQDAINLLQEWFGYALLPDTRQQKILLVVGPRRSGKGTIARVMRALVGTANVCAPTLGSLASHFGLWPLIGKTLAIVSDARLSGRTDAAAVTERLLSISGEDAQTIDRKHLPPLTTTLPTRFVILTNELPRLPDDSAALVGRLLVLKQTVSWYGREDPDLTSKLLGELRGIMLWAIAGWQRLRERGRYLQPQSGMELIEEMGDLASPTSAFVRDCCEVGPACRVGVKELFDRWKVWCNEKGRDHPGSEQAFGRNLRAAVANLTTRRVGAGGEQGRVFEGIVLKWTDPTRRPR